MMPLLLECKDLNIVIPGKQEKMEILDHVSFSVQKGEILGIVGESGCGKTMTSLAVMRLLSEETNFQVSGQILYENRNLLALSEKEMSRVRGSEIAMIFQDPMTSLNPLIPIGKQIAETILAHQKVSKKEAYQKAVELLRQVEISAPEKRMHQYPHELSGGMKQRIMIAIALSCGPKLLIADEPTTALDVTIQAQIIRLLKKIRRETGTAIILITHDFGVVSSIADRILVMYAGQIVEQAPSKKLFACPKHPYTEGLLKSIPKIDENQKELYVIEGTVPLAGQMPNGCRFYERCPRHTPECQKRQPAVKVLGDRSVKCLLYETAEEGGAADA